MVEVAVGLVVVGIQLAVTWALSWVLKSWLLFPSPSMLS